MTTCEEIRHAFSPYLDERLAVEDRAAIERHLETCPVCRAKLAELQILVGSLRGLSRPLPPSELAPAIISALRIEVAAAPRRPALPLSAQLIQWIQPRLMPYSVGAFASVILFMMMFAGLRSSLLAFHDWDVATRQEQDAVQFRAYSGYDITKPISAETYAAGRAPFSVDSPSLNPQGALAAFTRSALAREEDADDMVVVTDVFSNGSASLADIMQAPRDPRMLDEFQAALRENPPFVPASFDRRPQTMRVVFVIQKVDVRERQF